MEYNINNFATVTLTSKGADILNNYNKEAVSILKKYSSTNIEGLSKYNHLYTENDTYISELWDIMHIFGKHLFNGCDIPFVNNVINIK